MIMVDRNKVIELRVKDYMTPKEIWRELGFYSSVKTIAKIIEMAENDGTITQEEQYRIKEVISGREAAEAEKKRKAAEEIRKTVLAATKSGMTKTKIRKMLLEKYNKPISFATINKLEDEAVLSGLITEQEMEAIKEKRKNTNKVELSEKMKKSTQSNNAR